MTSTYSRKSNGNEYRYYVSSATLTGKRSVAGAIARFPAQTIEDIVNKTKRRLGLVGDEDDFRVASPLAPTLVTPRDFILIQSLFTSTGTTHLQAGART